MNPIFYSGDEPPKELAAFAKENGWDVYLWREMGEQSTAVYEPLEPRGDAFGWKRIRQDRNNEVDLVRFERVKSLPSAEERLFFVSAPYPNPMEIRNVCYWFVTDKDYRLKDYNFSITEPTALAFDAPIPASFDGDPKL